MAQNKRFIDLKINIMNFKILVTALLMSSIGLESCSNSSDENNPENQRQSIRTDGTKKIQVALLLDTSSSMDGLIEQAKSRLWNIVNTITTLRYEGKTPKIEIALYEYGNSGLTEETNYIRQITTLTTDLDLISEQLFSLSTNGGDEYCGAVIHNATKKMDWGNDASDMKLIYIAGNEEFDQGGVDFKDAIKEAREEGIYVNTIFCGDQEEGIDSFWKQGADAGLGKFFTIDADEEIVYIETPYDAAIAAYNNQINDTYIQFGVLGDSKKMNQLTQDRNSFSVSSSTATERIVSKSKAVYKNESWDLVDKVSEEKDAIKKMDKAELPKELRTKSTKEIEAFIQKKAKQREMIQQKIEVLAKKRQHFIDQEMEKRGGKDDLGGAIKHSIIALAKTKGYTVEA